MVSLYTFVRFAAWRTSSFKCLHKTFGWILVETADFKNRAIMLQ